MENFFSEINKHIYIQVENWYNHDGLYLHGCFYNKEEKGYFNNYLFCFSQTIESNKLQPLKNNLIFSNLKLYGSSHKYKGLKDIRGNVILSNQFDKIELFYTTEITIYFKIEKIIKKEYINLNLIRLKISYLYNLKTFLMPENTLGGISKMEMLDLCP